MPPRQDQYLCSNILRMHGKVISALSSHHRAGRTIMRTGLPAKRKRASPKCRLAVVKVASRCNLNCSYCYVYNLGDTSYLNQPAVMARQTVEALAARVAKHCKRHRLPTFTFAFHGGEPLLARPSFYRHFVACMTASLPARTQVKYYMQTNGMRLTPQWCALLRELNITVGISVDGPKHINDRYRVDHAGRGSYDRIRRGWNVAAASGLQPNLLAVIDVTANPFDVLHHLQQLNPRSVDFLLPQATHDRPPPRPAGRDGETLYGDWLLAIFRAWIADEGMSFRIRLFEHIIQAVLGMGRQLNSLGSGANEVLVIESDGSIEPVDVLKVCGNGLTRTPFNVNRNDLDDAFAHPMISLYHHSDTRLSATCRKCRLSKICAGGYLPHRYRTANGFDNPSIYCADLMQLITGIQNWVHSSLPDDIVTRQRLVPLSYAEARDAIAKPLASTTPAAVSLRA